MSTRRQPSTSDAISLGTTSAKSEINRAPRPRFSPEYRLMIERLREAVLETGVQQVEIAARIGKPKSYLTKVLLGNQAATLIELRAICIASGIPFVPWVTEVDQELSKGRVGLKQES